jgi:hypothetical protein
LDEQTTIETQQPEVVTTTTEPEKSNAREAILERARAIANTPDYKLGDEIKLPEPEAETAEEPQALVTAPESKPTLDPETYETGEAMGLSRSDVERLGEAGVWKLAARQSKPKAEPEAKKEPEKFEFKPFALELSEEDYDPKLVKAIKAMNEHNATMFQAAQRRLDELSSLSSVKDQVDLLAQERANAQREQFIQWADGQFASLGEGWSDVFGAGSIAKLDQNSDAYKRRVALLNEVSVYADAKRSRGEPVDRDALFKLFHTGMHQQDIQRIAGRKTQDRLRNQKGQYQEAPNQRQGPPESAREARDRRIREIASDPNYKFEKSA